MLRKSWFGGVFKPKNLHSLEHLRYLYSVLSKNQTVSESNRGLLVETLRSIAEILIWGDQNDSSVFDFFLEKNMLAFFLRIMRQKCGSYVCVQLLQTLNILFENIRNETSLYYLLSNNHVNSIIVHKFDFSDEEVMAYYISFLKTLSFKLNSHTIHFFYNEHTNDFPLYTEGIKFFNHPESMVRIAVRTLTLNVYRVNDQSMLQFIRDRTAAPYFSNLVWFIGNHILELDACVREDIDHNSRDRLSGLVAEHLDHLHYLNDILLLDITPLNHLLAHHLLHRLLLPLLVHSLLPPQQPRQVGRPPPALDDDSTDTDTSQQDALYTDKERSTPSSSPRISKVVALFLLSQVFTILSFPPLVATLARTLLHGGPSLLQHYTSHQSSCKNRAGFVAPEESLEKSLLSHGVSSPSRRSVVAAESNGAVAAAVLQGEAAVVVVAGETASAEQQTEDDSTTSATAAATTPALAADTAEEATALLNITDEEKQLLAYQLPPCCVEAGSSNSGRLSSRPFLQAVLEALDCPDSDYTTLFSLCLLYALGHNTGFSERMLAESFSEGEQQHESSREQQHESSKEQQPHESSREEPPPSCSSLAAEGGAAATVGQDNRLQNSPVLVVLSSSYNTVLVEKMLHVIALSTQYNSKVRVVTLENGIQVLKQLVGLKQLPSKQGDDQQQSEHSTAGDRPAAEEQCAESAGGAQAGQCEGEAPACSKRQRPVSGSRASLTDEHLAVLEGAREEATLVLRNFYKSEEMFLDLFEDEWSQCCASVSKPRESLRVEYLLQDSSILLPPTATPLTGIHLNKRRPCGEVERARRAMRVFFLVRGACLAMRGEQDHQLPLTKPSSCVRLHDVLDLNNSDLIACVVITRDGERSRRFLVIDVLQLILVEPDQRRLGWGVAKFVGFLQDLEVSGDKEDSRVLHLTLHRPPSSSSGSGRGPAPAPLLAAKFIFDDHIRCMAAKQRLCKGRNKARQRKLHQIARLLELPSHLQPCPSPPTHALSAMRQEAQHRRGSSSQREGRVRRSRGPGRAATADGSSVTQNNTSRLSARVEEIQLDEIGHTQTTAGHASLRRL